MRREWSSHWSVETGSGSLRSWICLSLFRWPHVVVLMGLVFYVSDSTAADPRSGPVQFKTHVIESKIPGGYSLLVSDMNRDGRPDVIGLSTRMSELAWYENPNWERHVLVREMNGSGEYGRP